MKKFGAFLAAAVIAMTVSTAAFALPDEESSTQTSQVQQAENSKKQENKQESKQESKKESSAKEVTAPEKMTFTECEIPDVGMHISLPDDMYILTADISPDDPALEALKMKKKDVEETFSKNNIAIRAYAKDFSFDIIVSVMKTDRTKAIGDLSSLAEKELRNVIEELMKNDYAKGNSINTYNNVLFLTLDTDIVTTGTDNHVYGKQEYTIVDGTNVIITFQSYNGQLSEDQLRLVEKVMNSVTFESTNRPEEVSDISTAKVNDLDIRYILIFAFVLIAIITFAIMIIVAARYRHSREELEEEFDDDADEVKKTKNGDKIIIKTPNTAIPVDDEKKQEKPVQEKKPYDHSLFEKADENVIFKNEKLAEEKKKREETRVIPRLDSTTELSIPGNPYTPVGKAEAVQQPALSVTYEIAKLSTITAEAEKAERAAVSDEDEDSGEIVFAESAPKAKTEIEQIGENVFEKPTAADEADNDENSGAELSEYEKRFGKNRSAAITESAATIVPINDDEKRQSKFEKYFGKIQPAQAPAKPEEDTIAEVDDIIRQEEKRSSAENDSAITVTVRPPQEIQTRQDDDKPLVRITKSAVPVNKEASRRGKTEAEESKPVKAETKAEELTAETEDKPELKAETKPQDNTEVILSPSPKQKQSPKLSLRPSPNPKQKQSPKLSLRLSPSPKQKQSPKLSLRPSPSPKQKQSPKLSLRLSPSLTARLTSR